MLGPFVFENFRVHSLDTLARLEELLIVIGDIDGQRLPMIAVEPLLSELIPKAPPSDSRGIPSFDVF
jgi:hypothetical protein